MSLLLGLLASRISFLIAFYIMGYRLRDIKCIKVAQECHCEFSMKQLLIYFMITRSEHTLLDSGPSIFLLASEVLCRWYCDFRVSHILNLMDL